ncbi:hypothetical protein J6Q66_04785 [bacterium]|nr:hypothetical protein [bacterium]
MYQLYVQKQNAFSRDLICESADFEEVQEKALKMKEKDETIKYTIEETLGGFNSYGDLLTEVIEEG